jgi:serine/threonine protein kinase
MGLKFLKENMIVHLDLKLENILLASTHFIKICDFGESYKHGVVDKDFKPGFTLNYSSPETLQLIYE